MSYPSEFFIVYFIPIGTLPCITWPATLDFEEISFNTFEFPKNGIAKAIFNNEILRKMGNTMFSTKTRSRLAKKFIYEQNPQKPKMLPEDWIFLENLYRKDILETQRIFGRTIPWLKNYHNNLNGK